MKMKMPFDGFYLKLLDEQNGTHEYEEYLRNCKENPLTEEEQREWTESARAAIAELERINAEPEPTRQAAEAEGTSRPQTPEPTELQEGCCTGQEAEDAPEVEVTVAKETSIPQGEGALLLPEEPTVIPEMASEPKRIRITELVKENFKNWRDGTRIVFDAGVNSGKTYFILNVLLPWAYQKHWKIIYLCNRVPLRNEIQQEVERLGRTEEKVGRWDHDLQQIVYETRVTNKYKDTIRVETYQWMESFCKGNPKGTMNYFKSFNYIVADEYHYLLTDAAINKYIDLSYVTLNELTKYRPVIFMSATAHPFFHRWRDETNEVLPENYCHIPSDYSYVERAVFYWTDAEEIKIIRQEARRGKVLVFVDRMSRLKKLVKELEDEFAGEIATACSPYRPEAREFDGLEEVLQDGKLHKRITIVTTVFYNGVNIKDPELICIISRLWDPIVNAQILGRKRPVSKQDTCAVYFKGYSHDRIKQEREHIRKRQLEPAKKWKEGKSDPEVWQEYLHKPGIVEMLDKYSKTVDRDEYGNGWEWRRRAEHQYLVQMDVDKESLVKFNGFLAPKAEGSYLILNEGGYQIEGQTDTWKVIDEKNVQEQRFVQLVCEQTKKQRPDIILHDSGVLVAQTIYGFDSSVMKKIEKFLREQKPELLHYQKFLENGTAERAKESGTEQNYNMIDGCVNNNPKKPRIIGNRISVLDRLHIKLEERKQKSQPQQQQQQERSRKN